MKKFVFYYVLLMFSINTHEFFHEKTKKVLQVLMLFKKFYMSQNANQIKYKYNKEVNFTTDQ